MSILLKQIEQAEILVVINLKCFIKLNLHVVQFDELGLGSCTMFDQNETLTLPGDICGNHSKMFSSLFVYFPVGKVNVY